MSWDVMIINARGVPADLETLPEDFESQPLGSAASLRELVSSVLPEVDWSDPSWGMFEGDGFSIELNIGEDDPVTDAMLHVRGSGDPLPSIVRLCKLGGWLAYDTSDGTAIDLDNPSRAGWEAFTQFRDQVIAKTRAGALDDALAGAAQAEASLPGSDLSVVDGKLIETDGDKVIASHALSEMRNLRFGTGTRLFAAVLAVLAVVLASAAKMFIPMGWLSWTLTAILGLVALIFLRAVRGEMLWFLEAGQERSYPLLGPSEEIEAFRSGLKRAWQEASRRR